MSKYIELIKNRTEFRTIVGQNDKGVSLSFYSKIHFYNGGNFYHVYHNGLTILILSMDKNDNTPFLWRKHTFYKMVEMHIPELTIPDNAEWRSNCRYDEYLFQERGSEDFDFFAD